MPEYLDRTGLALRRRKCASRGVLKNCLGLRKAYAGKPFDELIDRSAVFKIFKEGCHGHARATKEPSAAVALGVAFNCIAGRPINHGTRIALGGTPLPTLMRAESGLRRLTFDMRGAQKAQPFGHPLDGRVRPHAQQRKPTFETRNFGGGLHGQSVAVTNPTVAKSRCRA